MPTREWMFRILDIVEAIERIETYTNKMDYAQFLDDRMVQDAVIRNLEIIGEAASHVPEEVRKQHSMVPWSEMKVLRNIVAHEYFRVDEEVIWTTIQADLMPVKTYLVKLLNAS